MAGPRPANVAALVACDIEAFANDRRNSDGSRMTADAVALVNESTLEEVQAARDILARRQDLHLVDGDRPSPEREVPPAGNRGTHQDRTPSGSVDSSTTKARQGREMPAIAVRWQTPKECAAELREVFGPYFCQMLVIEIARDMRGGR